MTDRAPPAAPTPRAPLRRLTVFVAALLLLAWAWHAAGLGSAGRLWTNRERAVHYILGRPADDASPAERRAQAERDVRTQLQESARADIEAAYAERGENPPGLMTLMREAERRAASDIAALPPGDLDARIDERAAELAGADRRGGYFPPESDPRAIFGDPDELGRLHPLVRWAPDAAARLDPRVERAVRWALVAVAGEGYTGELCETIAIAVWGTLLAVAAAVPAAVLGSQRGLAILAPGRGPFARALRWIGRFVVRRGFDAARGFNEVVLAMILVAVLGLGPLPGVIALLVHTFGVLGKVFADAIDAADPGPIEGVAATGAAPTQIVAYAVFPQIMPYVVSQSLLRFESNVRGATILGVVGAGGIGQLLMDKFNAFQFREVATMMLIIIVVVTVIDLACARAMKRLV